VELFDRTTCNYIKIAKNWIDYLASSPKESKFASNLWKAKGDALTALEKYDEAIEAYDKAIEVDSRFPTAWTGKGDALMKLNRNKEANEAYAKAKEIKKSGGTYRM